MPENIDAAIEQCFEKHFGNFTPGTEIYVALHTFKRDLRVVLGLTATQSPPETEPQEK